jgi:hypothetical protein
VKKIRLGAGSGWAPSDPIPALELVEKGDIDYLGFDQLAELTMAVLQITRTRDPKRGYVWQHIIDGMKLLLAPAHKKGITIITNGGGVNCEEAANQVLNIARENGLNDLKIGVVNGDDIMGKLDDCRKKGWAFRNLDTGEDDIDSIKDRIVSAHAYIGGDGIMGALGAGANVVITGRVSDNALFVAPIMHEFGWNYAEPYWNSIGAAVTVGHIIECASWCCGQNSVLWDRVPRPWDIGYPIAEFHEDGTAIITKVPGSGGMVNEWTVKEQLVYEVHDPRNYLMPDGIADLTTLRLEDLGDDRVRITNMSGKPRPDTLKVQIGYADGFIAENMTIIGAPHALRKARHMEEVGRARLQQMGLGGENVEVRVDYVGINSLLGPVAPMPEEDSVNEVGLRIAAKTKTAQEAQRIVAAFGIMTGTPLGVGFSAPRAPRPVIALWPTLIPRDEVPVNFVIKGVQ